MLKKIIEDYVNDITLFHSMHGFSVRYGLSVTHHREMEKALTDFWDCMSHAMSANANT